MAIAEHLSQSCLVLKPIPTVTQSRPWKCNIERDIPICPNPINPQLASRWRVVEKALEDDGDRNRRKIEGSGLEADILRSWRDKPVERLMAQEPVRLSGRNGSQLDVW